jgi:ATP-dependent Clp protease ATP-binding subunit ClpX
VETGNYSELIKRGIMPVKKYKSELIELIDAIPLLTPMEMNYLLANNGYVGQEKARQAVCLMAYRHINRIKKIYIEEVDRNILPSKENILLIGPTGCGKTYLIELLFQKVLKIPTVIIDITSYSETGYVGQDVPSILTKLFFASKSIPEFSTIGIICIDEFDKISSGKNIAVFAGQGSTKDVTGLGVQRELLKMLETGEIDIPSELSHSSYAPRIVVNTQDIPFIACGAFTGFKNSIQNSTHNTYSENDSIGFTSLALQKYTDGISRALAREDVEKAANFEAYGILPELIGRFSRIIPFDALDANALKDILINNTITKYSAELALDDIKLKIDENVFDEIIRRCMIKETGARSLKSAIVEYLEDACYKAYSIPRNNKTIHLFFKKHEIESEILL